MIPAFAASSYMGFRAGHVGSKGKPSPPVLLLALARGI